MGKWYPKWFIISDIFVKSQSADPGEITIGITDTFTLTDITKQGTIMGPILNNYSLDRICVEGQGYQLGSAYIKPLEYVDDIANPNNDFEEAIGSNADIEKIQKETRSSKEHHGSLYDGSEIS